MPRNVSFPTGLNVPRRSFTPGLSRGARATQLERDARNLTLSKRLDGRFAYTKGFEKAATYCAFQLREAGFEPLLGGDGRLEDYFQRIPNSDPARDKKTMNVVAVKRGTNPGKKAIV